MNEEIVDDLEVEKAGRHSIKAFRRFIISTLSLALAVLLLMIGITPNSESFVAIGICLLNGVFINFLGLISSFRSFYSNEDEHHKRLMGLAGNVFLMVIYIVVYFLGRS